jgi:O-antigen ligase
VKPSALGPAGLALAAVLAFSVVAPPDVRGLGSAAVALFALMAAVATREAAASAAARLLFMAIPLAIVVARAGIAPGETIEPTAWILLAAMTGISAGFAAVDAERLAPVVAALVTFAGLRAIYEAAWGLSSWAEQLRRSAPGADAAAMLNRLEQGRAYGGFLTPAALGCFLAMTVPAVVAWAWGRRGTVRAAGLAAATIGSAGLVATRSLTAIGALAGALAIAAIKDAAGRRAAAWAIGVLAAAVLAVALMRPDDVLAPGRADSPWRLRAGNVRVALEIARDHPVAGVGPGGYAEAFPSYRRPGDNETHHAHDLPAELIAEWGIPAGAGLAGLFFWIFLTPALASRGSGRPFASGLAVGLAVFAVHNLVDFTTSLPSLLVVACVSRGLIVPRARPASASPALRAAWAALALVLALAVTGAGLSRESLQAARAPMADGDHAGVAHLAELAGRLAPWDADPPMLEAEALMAGGGEPAVALASAERAVARAPHRALARAVRGRARNEAGDPSGAYADFAEAARLYPMRADYASQRDAFAAALTRSAAEAPR